MSSNFVKVSVISVVLVVTISSGTAAQTVAPFRLLDEAGNSAECYIYLEIQAIDPRIRGIPNELWATATAVESNSSEDRPREPQVSSQASVADRPATQLAIGRGENPGEIFLSISNEIAKLSGPALSTRIFCANYQPIDINFGPLESGRSITLPVRTISLKPRNSVRIMKISQVPLKDNDVFAADVIIRNSDAKAITTKTLIFFLQHGAIVGGLSAIDHVEQIEVISTGGEEKGSATVLGEDIHPKIQDWFPYSNNKDAWNVKTEFLHEIPTSKTMLYRFIIRSPEVPRNFYDHVKVVLLGYFNEPEYANKSLFAQSESVLFDLPSASNRRTHLRSRSVR